MKSLVIALVSLVGFAAHAQSQHSIQIDTIQCAGVDGGSSAWIVTYPYMETGRSTPELYFKRVSSSEAPGAATVTLGFAYETDNEIFVAGQSDDHQWTILHAPKPLVNGGAKLCFTGASADTSKCTSEGPLKCEITYH